MKRQKVWLKYISLLTMCFTIFCLSKRIEFSFPQSVSLTVFSASVLAILFFWESRVAISFWGIAALILTKTIDIEHLVLFSSLEVILFLVGMMVIVGLLREVNFFNWLLCRLVTLKRMTAVRLVVIIVISSALMACLVDEVTSIIFMVALIFALTDYFEINPVPFLIITVLSTNIGSIGTVLGNPIGVLIAIKAGLTFEGFIIHSFPIMLIVLGAIIGIVLFWWSVLDNVVLVAAFIPVINELKSIGAEVSSLWWALLFGGCLGGNIAMVGSTPNIVALGLLEKKNKLFIPFF